MRLGGSRETQGPQQGPCHRQPKDTCPREARLLVLFSCCFVGLCPKVLRMPLQETSGDTQIKSDTCSSEHTGYLGTATLGVRHCFWFDSTAVCDCLYRKYQRKCEVIEMTTACSQPWVLIMGSSPEPQRPHSQDRVRTQPLACHLPFLK